MTKIPNEVFSRVSGYYRPVYTNGKTGQWNKGKQSEFEDRKYINVNKIMEDFSFAQSNIKNRL